MVIYVENERPNGSYDNCYLDCEIFPCKNIFCIDYEGRVEFPSFIAISDLENIKPDSGLENEITTVACLSSYEQGEGFWTTCEICECLYRHQFEEACIYKIKLYDHRMSVTDAVQFVLDDFKCHGIPIHPEVYRYIRSKKYLKNVEL